VLTLNKEIDLDFIDVWQVLERFATAGPMTNAKMHFCGKNTYLKNT